MTYPQSKVFFLSKSQMLLLHTLIEFVFNNDDALTALNLIDVTSIFSINRLVFFPLGTTKSNLSENVL